MDTTKLKTAASRLRDDVSGAFAVAMAHIGDRLGLFAALAQGPATSDELAARAGLDERYVREWLKAMVAAEYIDCDADGRRFEMTPEQIAILADEGGPAFMGGAVHLVIPLLARVPRVMEAFRAGARADGPIDDDAGDREVAEAIHRMHCPAFEHHLVQRWIPAIPGLAARLADGIDVLDVGCGLGQAVVVLARAFPRSRVVGLDTDPYSIDRARLLAADAGVPNVSLVAGALADVPATARYQLVTAFDCVHDMADPVAELGRIRRMLGDDGQLLWMEPSGSDNPLHNRTPAGVMRAGLSPLHCMTVSLAAGGAGLGTIIGERGVRDLAARAGLARVDRLDIDDPLHLFFLARP